MNHFLNPLSLKKSSRARSLPLRTGWLWRLLGLLLVMGLAGCGGGHRAIDHGFAGDCWAVQDTLRATLAAQDLPGPQRVVLRLTVDESYDYSNLYVGFRLAPTGQAASDPSSDTSPESRTEFVLMDPAGNWFSQSGWWARLRGIHHFEQTLLEGFELPPGGEFELTLTQQMRADTICGIRHIGLAFVPQ